MKNATTKSLLAIAGLLSTVLVSILLMEHLSEITPVKSCALNLEMDLLDSRYEFLSADNKTVLAWDHEAQTLTRFNIKTEKGAILLTPFETAPLTCEQAKENCLPRRLFEKDVVLEPIQFWNNFGIIKAHIAQRTVYLPVMWTPEDLLRIGSPLGICRNDMASETRSFTYSNGLLVTTFPEFGAYGYYNMLPFYSGVPLGAPRHPDDLWAFQKDGWAQAECKSLQPQQQDLVLNSSNNFVSLMHFKNFQGQTHYFMSTKGTLFELSGSRLPKTASQVAWMDANTIATSSEQSKWNIFEASHIFDFAPISELQFDNPVDLISVEQSSNYLAVEKPQNWASQTLYMVKRSKSKNEIMELGDLPRAIFTTSPKLVWAQNFNDSTISFFTKKERQLRGYQISCETSGSL